MKELKGRVAAVTGAGGGLGRALAFELARRGCALALCDLDSSALESTRRECEALGVETTARTLDVSDRAGVYAWADEVVAEHGRVDLVINNAGATVVATARNLTLTELEWLMGVNFWGVVHGTKAFLPHLEASGSGHVVNISSAFGLIGYPGQAAYSASKFAVRGFTEALAMELHVEGVPVQAHVVHPGGVATGIARNARMGSHEPERRPREAMNAEFDRMARTSAEAAARTIVDGVCRGKPRILVGADARGISLMQRLLPGAYQRLVRFGSKRRGLGQV